MIGILGDLIYNARGHCLLLVRCRQRRVRGIDDEDRQQARGLLVARILTDPVMRVIPIESSVTRMYTDAQ